MKNQDMFKSIYDRVGYILLNHPETRSDDKMLYTTYVFTFHQNEIYMVATNSGMLEPSVPFSVIHQIPHTGILTRYRAKYQSMKKFMPRDNYTLEKREKLSDAMRMYF